MCITRIHNFCINEGNEGYAVGTNGEVDQGGEDEAMHLPVDESGIAESSMLRDIWFIMACKDQLLVKPHIISF